MITLGDGFVTNQTPYTFSISNSPDIKKNIKGLADLAKQIGDPQIAITRVRLVAPLQMRIDCSYPTKC